MNKIRQWTTDVLLATLVFIATTLAIWTPALVAQQIVRAKTYSHKKVEVYYSKDSQRCFAYLSGGEKKAFKSHREASNYAASKGGKVRWVLMTPSVKAEIRREEAFNKRWEDGKP